VLVSVHVGLHLAPLDGGDVRMCLEGELGMTRVGGGRCGGGDRKKRANITNLIWAGVAGRRGEMDHDWGRKETREERENKVRPIGKGDEQALRGLSEETNDLGQGEG